MAKQQYVEKAEDKFDSIMGNLRYARQNPGQTAKYTAQGIAPGLKETGKWIGTRISKVVNPPPPEIISPLSDDFVRATPTPRVTPQPAFNMDRLEPLATSSGTPKRTWYTGGKEAPQNANRPIESGLWEEIGKRNEPEWKKRNAYALAAQESSGGTALTGDAGESFGAYHIQPKWHPISKEDAMNNAKSTDYLMNWMQKRYDRGVPSYKILKAWNPKSVSPNYEVDLPQMATMSAFYRKK